MKSRAPHLWTAALWVAAILMTWARPAAADVATARAGDRPAAGTRPAGYEPVDKAVTDAMDRVGATAAAAAVFADGRLVYARGFGWRDEGRTVPTEPDDLFRIASVSKVVTAVVVEDLVRAGALSLDEKVFPYLGLMPKAAGREGGEKTVDGTAPAATKPAATEPAPTGPAPTGPAATRPAATQPTATRPATGPAGADAAAADPRLADVTVRHLLAHQGGWDREAAGDPMFRLGRVASALRLTSPVGPDHLVRYMATQPLQFRPGERSVYSNFGYCVLGRVVEKAAGRTFDAVLRQRIRDPLKIAGIRVGRDPPEPRDPHEVWSPVPAGGYSLDVLDACGGLVASAPALGQLAQAYWIDGEPRRPGAKGASMVFFGSLPGTSAMLLQRPDGTDVAVLLNARRDRTFQADLQALRAAVNAAIDAAPPAARAP
jgi:CubicO group peptidase (beta-lactamase class C family)